MHMEQGSLQYMLFQPQKDVVSGFMGPIWKHEQALGLPEEVS